jgi:DNA-binding NtrC family response regulator
MESTAISSKLLVVSADPTIMGVVLAVAAENRWLAETATDAWDALDKVPAVRGFELLVLDLPKHPSDGLQILRALRRFRPTLAAVLIGYPSDLERKQEALQMGVSDYLERPVEDRQLELAIRRNLRATTSPQPIEGIGGYKSLRSLLRSVKEEAEKKAISQALEQTGWNRKAAARLLKVSYRSVLYKIDQYQMISPPRSAAPYPTQAAMPELGGAMEAGKSAYEFQHTGSDRFNE